MNTMKRIWMQVTRTSLASRNPTLAAQWHPHRNGTLTPQLVKHEETADFYWWQCQVNPKHVWESPLAVRVRSNGVCPSCEQEAYYSLRLVDAFPEVKDNWVPDLNPGVILNFVPMRSRRKFTWQCQENPKHVWESTPYDLVYDGDGETRRKTLRGCPRCELKRSKVSVSEVGAVA